MEENKIPEKFLPIGTVVLLKNGKKEVMITRRWTYQASELRS